MRNIHEIIKRYPREIAGTALLAISLAGANYMLNTHNQYANEPKLAGSITPNQDATSTSVPEPTKQGFIRIIPDLRQPLAINQTLGVYLKLYEGKSQQEDEHFNKYHRLLTMDVQRLLGINFKDALIRSVYDFPDKNVGALLGTTDGNRLIAQHFVANIDEQENTTEIWAYLGKAETTESTGLAFAYIGKIPKSGASSWAASFYSLSTSERPNPDEIFGGYSNKFFPEQQPEK